MTKENNKDVEEEMMKGIVSAIKNMVACGMKKIQGEIQFRGSNYTKYKYKLEEINT